MHVQGYAGGTSAYALSVLLVIVVSVACIPLSPIIGYRPVSLILLLVVLIMPLTFGRGQVFVAAGVAVLSWNFLFIPPVYTFAIGGVDDLVYWGVFVVVTTVSGSLAARLREREQHARALFALTKDLSSAHSQQEVLQAAASHITTFFRSDVAIFLGEPDGDIMPTPHASSTWIPDSSDSRAAAWAYWNEKSAGRSTEHHPDATGLFVPMSGPRYPIGVIGARPGGSGSFSGPRAQLLENFVTQVGLACERELLNDLNSQAILVSESERLYGTLFNSISHELCTPLASILGASENLQTLVEPGLGSLASSLVTEVRTSAERLDRLVANLLDMSRVESGLLRPKADWTDLRDVVSGALRELTKTVSGRSIVVDIPESLPLLRADFGLLQQALMNIMHNAVVHTPASSRIDITARVTDRRCLVSVADTGSGIAVDDLGRVFEKFYRSGSAVVSGTGLGLPIAKGLIEAQGGTVSVRNRDGGGAVFEISLQLDEGSGVG